MFGSFVLCALYISWAIPCIAIYNVLIRINRPMLFIWWLTHRCMTMSVDTIWWCFMMISIYMSYCRHDMRFVICILYNKWMNHCHVTGMTGVCGYYIHCVLKKVSPLKILQYHEQNFTELNIILRKDSHKYFKQWCEVSAKYTLAFIRNQTLIKTGQKFD